ncbi:MULTISPECIES: NTF2-like N-terminal transpeptidase domain-containing protein [unclassified Nocardia]|uniref:NTF2-like N-terminal transpeptidase domain-containing protein n=1 Tax=unclassified Nocardia TaxID=2637762 RepID=UPI0034164010
MSISPGHGVGPHMSRARWSAALGALILAVALSGCACSFEEYPDDARVAVEEFTALLNKRDADNAAKLTSQPVNAAASLRQIFEGLGPGAPDFRLSQFIALDTGEGIFALQGAWTFGPDRSWTYDAQGTVRKLATGWRISWEPTIAMPQLDNTRKVHLVKAYPTPPPVVKDSLGQTLMSEQIIAVVRLDPARITDLIATTDALAKAIAPVAPLITGESLRAQLAAAKGQPVVAVNLRQDDFAVLEPDITPIPGVVVQPQPRLISADRRIQSPMLDALRTVWQQNRDRTAGWAVQLSGPDGLPVANIAGQQGTPAPDVPATLDPYWQRAAQDAVNYLGNPAAVVAIRPATGAIVAAAENNAASTNEPVAFAGLAPIGGTTELLRTAAATIAHKPPQNVSLDEIGQAARMLGLGVDFELTGLDKVSSRIPTPGTEEVRRGGRASEIQASPYGMAIFTAAIANGHITPPMIEIGRPATSAESSPLPAAVVDQLRALIGGGGYVTTAGGQGWLLANTGELVFALHVEDPDSSTTLRNAAERIFHPNIAEDRAAP